MLMRFEEPSCVALRALEKLLPDKPLFNCDIWLLQTSLHIIKVARIGYLAAEAKAPRCSKTAQRQEDQAAAGIVSRAGCISNMHAADFIAATAQDQV